MSSGNLNAPRTAATLRCELMAVTAGDWVLQRGQRIPGYRIEVAGWWLARRAISTDVRSWFARLIAICVRTTEWQRGRATFSTLVKERNTLTVGERYANGEIGDHPPHIALCGLDELRQRDPVPLPGGLAS